jgi:general secretion pathway protein G
MTRGDAAAGRQLGFTLIELITVMALVSILTAIALPNYRVAVTQSREAVLLEDLFRMRDVIDQYYADKGKYPPTLGSLVEAGYLRAIPSDPIAGGTEWETVLSEPDPSRPNEEPGIFDIHSRSTDVSLRGTPYNEW